MPASGAASAPQVAAESAQHTGAATGGSDAEEVGARRSAAVVTPVAGDGESGPFSEEELRERAALRELGRSCILRADCVHAAGETALFFERPFIHVVMDSTWHEV